MSKHHIEYAYTHTTTEATTGYFSCEPVQSLNLKEALKKLKINPLDEFLHTYTLRLLNKLNLIELKELIPKNPNEDLVLCALLLECATLNNELLELKEYFSTDIFSQAIAYTPLIYLEWSKLLDSQLHQKWGECFNANINNHHLLPHPDDDEMALLYEYEPNNPENLVLSSENISDSAENLALSSEGIIENTKIVASNPENISLKSNNIADSAENLAYNSKTISDNVANIVHANKNIINNADNISDNAKISANHAENIAENSELISNSSKNIIKKIRLNMLKEKATPWSRPPAQETASHALELLVDNGIIAGVEMRHEASLSPIALLRKWNINVSVKNNGLDYSLNGFGTTYGRGLSVADARASYAMEMIERACAYASIDNNMVLNTVKPMPLIKAKYSELNSNNILALDPNSLALEAPYTDFELYWIEAELAQSQDIILVPAQIVYLFCNLDEKSLFISAGSTGLASGNTLAEAKLSALTEILERDAEATIPYVKNNCFLLRSNNERIQSLFDDYKSRGIHLQFQDITTKFGIPCYQCFLRDFKGNLIKATGANIDGARAAISALTEVPYAYPNSKPTAPPLKNLPERILEDLPSYSMESPTRNLKFLETLFLNYGLRPIYVEITREDLEFPVVRAIIPELEPNSEFDKYKRIRKPLFNNYLKMFR